MPFARSSPRRGAGVLPLLALIGLFVWLVPPGSTPVGYDVWWNLLVAETWAGQLGPSAMPAAGFTPLAEQFQTRQLAFDLLLALGAGTGLAERAVPPLLWASIAVQSVALAFAIRLLQPRAGANWLLLLPVVSPAWLFRATELRAMLLGVPCLLVLLGVAAARAGRGRPHVAWLGFAAAAYGYCHGAVLLPWCLWCVAAAGTRLQTGSWPWRDGLWVAGGLLFASLARPAPGAHLELLWLLNVAMPAAVLRGELPVLPLELLPLPFVDLLRTQWPYLLAAGLAGVVACRQSDRRWALWLPAFALLLAPFAGRRHFETAAPTVVLLLAVSIGRPLPLGLALALCAAGSALHLPAVAAAATHNRLLGLDAAGAWLAARARPGDVVFVTDWGLASPLAWHARGAGLVFTGMTDPSWMWHADPSAYRAWCSVVDGSAADPLAVAQDRFGARFVLLRAGDMPLDQARGVSGAPLRAALARAVHAGVDCEVALVARRWLACDLTPIRPARRVVGRSRRW